MLKGRSLIEPMDLKTSFNVSYNLLINQLVFLELVM